MRTRVSIPDPLFAEAEALAHRRGISRSQLYAEALDKHLKRERASTITEVLNRVLGEQPPLPDPFLTCAALMTFKRVEW